MYVYDEANKRIDILTVQWVGGLELLIGQTFKVKRQNMLKTLEVLFMGQARLKVQGDQLPIRAEPGDIPNSFSV